MNITGQFAIRKLHSSGELNFIMYTHGAFYDFGDVVSLQQFGAAGFDGTLTYLTMYNFDASRNWTGVKK